jgi:hypothetical protein
MSLISWNGHPQEHRLAQNQHGFFLERFLSYINIAYDGLLWIPPDLKYYRFMSCYA